MGIPADIIDARMAVLRDRLGARYREATFGNFRLSEDPDSRTRQSVAIASIERYVATLDDRSDGGGLMLMGPVGTGKDHLMAAAAIVATEKGFAVRWRDGASLFGEVREYAGPVPGAGVCDALAKAEVLCLSDPVPPTGTLEPRQLSWLFRLIDARYREMRPTWISANAANHTQAAAMFGEQNWDRLRHDATVVSCNWPSYRKGA